MIRRIFAILIAASPLLLILPKTANAQIYVTSEFLPGSDAQHLTAHCQTSAVDPRAGANSPPSPAGEQYLWFSATCDVTLARGPGL